MCKNGWDVTEWGLSSVQPAAHETRGHSQSRLNPPCAVPSLWLQCHCAGGDKGALTPHSTRTAPTHLMATAPCEWRGMSGPIHIHISQDLQVSPTSPSSSHLKQQHITSSSQHSTFTTKLVVKWKFKGTFKNFINATWTYAFRLFIFKWDVTCNLVAILSIVFHF